MAVCDRHRAKGESRFFQRGIKFRTADGDADGCGSVTRQRA